MTGEIKIWPGATAPNGHYECNGQAIDRVEDAGIYAVIGNTWGAGNEATTFNLPDMRDRVPVGFGSNIARGEIGGDRVCVLDLDKIPSHNHLMNVNNASSSNRLPSGEYLGGESQNKTSFYGSTLATPATLATDAITNTGGDIIGATQPHNNMPPYTGMMYIIER